MRDCKSWSHGQYMFFSHIKNKLPKFSYMRIAVQWKCKLLSYRLTFNWKLHPKSRNLLLLVTKKILRGAGIICDRCCHRFFYKASMWQNLIEQHNCCTSKRSFSWNSLVMTATTAHSTPILWEKLNVFGRDTNNTECKKQQQKKGSFQQVMLDSWNRNSSGCPEIILCVSR